jgi:CBS domain-containing protein
MKVKDVMTSVPLKFCTADTNLASAARTMKRENLGALPVVDKNLKVVGLVTDRDICLSLADKPGRTAAEISIREIHPHSRLHTVKSTDDVEEALREMRKYKIGRLPVIDKTGKLKGMLSINNLLTHALSVPGELDAVTSNDESLAKTIKTLFERNRHHTDNDVKENSKPEPA